MFAAHPCVTAEKQKEICFPQLIHRREGNVGLLSTPVYRLCFPLLFYGREARGGLAFHPSFTAGSAAGHE